MTPQQRKEAARFLKAFDFSGLFTDPSIGWNWPDSVKPIKVPTLQGFRDLEVSAEKKGVMRPAMKSAAPSPSVGVSPASSLATE